MEQNWPCTFDSKDAVEGHSRVHTCCCFEKVASSISVLLANNSFLDIAS
ncbi:protein of unknown function [Shewanella benthica]|uniref:Uncharacterized protein n=1 Tax=Shewanella benthica TaxID=43661 RepID=A0A330M530_9GAMM|nr:hypothetical protein [Shewanella benthica]SQH77606.1 protein of unknown function [Shewanella benthica]